jgi:hypothetical protein
MVEFFDRNMSLGKFLSGISQKAQIVRKIRGSQNSDVQIFTESGGGGVH